MKKIIIPVIIILIIGIASKIGIDAYISKNSEAVNKNNKETITVEVPEGSSVGEVTEILYKEKLIKNKAVFKQVVKSSGKESDIKAGAYYLSQSMSVKKIIKKMTANEGETTISFTIPEGYELRNISEELEKKGLVKSKDFLKKAEDINYIAKLKENYSFLNNDEITSLEGYLFPDTYAINKATEGKEELIIEMMLDNFSNKFDEVVVNKNENVELTDREIVVLASVVEREAAVPEERPIISGVFQNRLKSSTKLESCATVQYIIGERKPVLSTEDTRIESPFNTYMNEGLPPSPIASPGLDSMKAVVSPEETEYLFFVANGNGSHTFSKTYEEHLKAQKKIENK